MIAAQAVITGAYSLTRQAIQLGFLPRLVIRHTSEAQPGQIYLPLVNWVLLGGLLGPVVVLETSGALAMPLWRDRLFIAMTRIAGDPSDFYHCPATGWWRSAPASRSEGARGGPIA